MVDFQDIDIIIDVDGTTELHVQGVHGTSCLDLTADLEKALGGDVSRRFSAEYHHKKDEKLNHLNQFS